MNLSNYDHKTKIINNINLYGGSFMQRLANLIQVADSNNLRKIETTWKDELTRYYNM